MKRFATTMLCCLLGLVLMAQKPKTVVFQTETLTAQLLEHVNQAISDDSRKKENAKTVAAFETAYNAMPAQLQARVADIFNAAVKSKMKQNPDLVNFTAMLTQFYTSSDGKLLFDDWCRCVEYLQGVKKKSKDLLEFVEFTDKLLQDRIIYKSHGSQWQLQSGVAIRFVQEGKQILVRVETPCELYYSSERDNGTIYGTKGTYSYFDNKWHGEGGRLNWDRTGVPTTACWATLREYEAVVKFPKFTADSVLFVNNNYFQEPIYGRVEESLGNKMEPEKYNYPKFRSYQKNFVLKDVLDGVDYQGSFMMNGSKFVTSDEKNPATMIFYRNGERFITVRSTKFTITHSKMTSERATVNIYMGNDSITNNGVTVRYLSSDHNVTLINDNKRNYYSPYTNSYHNLDMYCEQIVWKTGSDVVDFSMVGQPGSESFSTFESKNYFSSRKLRELQGIDEVNPAVRVYGYMKEIGMAYDFSITALSNYLRYDMVQTKSMVHTLAKSGLVSFDEMRGIVYVQEKLVDYVRAYNKDKNSDYDAITLESAAPTKNAQLDLNTNDLKVYGVKKFVVSDSQHVAIYPRGGDVVVRKNRDILFSGRINVGRFVMYVTDGALSYDNFSLDLPKIDSVYFYVTKFNNPAEDHIVYTPLYNLVGSINIDAPDNHSGLKKNKDYPIFNSTQESFVYYDRKDIYHGTYARDRFYYTLRPFTIKQLADFETDSLQFNGSLTSAGIFPEIVEPLRVQPDYSLGFVVKAPKGGYEAYGGKGQYHNTISLSYQGLKGSGKLDYLTAEIQSKEMTFMPDSMLSISDTFMVREEGVFPDIRNGKALQRWYPYQDSMQVVQLKQGHQFQMYHNDAYLSGSVTLRPQGAYASGRIAIHEGTLESPRFELHPMDLASQVSTFTLQSEVYKTTAFFARNLKSNVDFTTRRGEFLSNATLERTQLPVMQYVAFVDKFSWEMDRKELDLINSKSEATQGLESLRLRDRMIHQASLPGARFVSTDPKQDSLQFFSTRGIYRYNEAQLSCRNVFMLNVADAVIAPNGDSLRLQRGGVIDLLQKAELLASRQNQNHLFYNSDLVVKGRREYSGKGYIDYIDEDEKVQRIFMPDIAPDVSGMTVAQGFIADSANFTLNSAFGFAGKVRVEAEREHYYFEGGVRLLHRCTPAEQLGLLAYADYLNPKQIHIQVPEIPTDWKGGRITASVLFNKSTLKPYPAFLTKERAADNELAGAHGMLTYDKQSQRYIIASERKLDDFDGTVDRYLSLNTQTCLLQGEGPIWFGMMPKHVKMFAYGNITIDPNRDEANTINSMFGLTFPIDDKVLSVMAQFIADDLRLSASNPDNELVRHAMVYYMGEEKGSVAYSDYVSTNAYVDVPKEFNSTLLLENLQWKYSPTLGYYHNGVASLASVGKKQLHLAVRVKAQIYKRGNGTYLTLYLQVAGDHWYYFNYEYGTQTMTIYSSVGEWVDMIKQIPADKRQVEGNSALGTYRYKIGSSRSEVQNFLIRMEGTTGDVQIGDDDDDEGYEDEEE